MNAHERELFERIANYAFDEGGETLTIAARLARENGWSKVFAHRAIAEYRRFVWLALAAGHSVTPSDAVDQVWHLHLTYTRSYWDCFCGEILRQPLHHGPTKGGAAESERYLDQYERTLASYREYFGEDPPTDLWPAAAVHFGADAQQVRVNTARYWIIHKPHWKSPSMAALAVVPMLGFFPLWADASGAIFAIALIVLFAVVICRLITKISGGGGSGSNSSGCGGCGGCGSGCGGCSGCGGG
jgi:hypothetical protein